MIGLKLYQDLPQQISILPLAVDNEGKVTYKLMPIDKIFVTLAEKEEQGICGVAELVPGQDATELYKKFSVRACSQDDYIIYRASFKETYKTVKFPMGSPFNSKLIIYKDDSPPGL